MWSSASAVQRSTVCLKVSTHSSLLVMTRGTTSQRSSRKVLNCMISRRRKLRRNCAANFLPISLILFAGLTHAQLTTSYLGQLDLPSTLYTGDGVQLEKGRYQIEIRTEKGRHFLVFMRDGEIVSLVNEKPHAAGEEANKRPDVAMIGTVYLHPPAPPKVREHEEKATVTFAEHLKSRPWKAALRVYRFSVAQSNEVDFELDEEIKPGEWSRADFGLFLKKPT